MPTSSAQRRQFEQMPRTALARYQLDRLNELIEKIWQKNKFYTEKLSHVTFPLASIEQLVGLPFTFKEELVAAASEGRPGNLTYPIERYTRFHRTSGTQGRPLVILDTCEDWKWWISTWQYVLDAANLGDQDRGFMAFSFGPFIGFWSAFDAAAARGIIVIPSGGMSSLQRLDFMRATKSNVLFCTPTYALHLMEVAAEHNLDVASLEIRKIIVAGEPGGSVPAIRERIESAWQATLIDHSGASEVGPWGYADEKRQGLKVVESEFIAEFLSVETGLPATEGELSELVITTLGRTGCPVIRYRTGDLVRPRWNSSETNRFVLLEGGVLGRSDDMMIIRGVNIFPSSLEQILRSFPEIVEFRITAFKSGEMDVLSVEIEDRLEQPQRVVEEFQIRLGLNVTVENVPLGSLPRYEAKGKRFVDKR
ncbi:MAG: phenylacetate--CoA ligase family protein [Pirellulaceae bacterium]|nr:phenylacetate--CoA ligase family protein [Pirellulaceae bacterium]